LAIAASESSSRTIILTGPLTADATEPAWNGYLLTVACPCGVMFERWVTPLEAGLDLLRATALWMRSRGLLLVPTAAFG
jgi:hypothetical protein